MKMSIADVKRRLPAGQHWIGTFVGRINTVRPAGEITNRRRVVKQSGTMVSEFVGGSRDGEKIYLNWKGVTAEERDGAIWLTMNEVQPPEEFLRIEVVHEAKLPPLP